MKNTKEQDLQARVRELEEELQHLRNSKKYGLVWDSEREPEQVVVDCQTKLPILKEIKERKILSDDSWDSNLLIEGDNYHALQVLSYTHKEAIDVIYIDPPYNTGNKDFIYNDKIVDSEDTYRHSKWLNFMEKRLRLAYDLLKEDGVIFISIDDNEQAQLKLLCDEIFWENNFIWDIIILSNPRGSQASKHLANVHEYILVYSKNESLLNIWGFKKSESNTNEYNKTDDNGKKYRLLGLRQRWGEWKREQRPNMYYPIYVNPYTLEVSLEKTKEFYIESLPQRPTWEDGRWTWSKEKLQKNLSTVVGKKVSRNGNDNFYDIFRKDYLESEDWVEKLSKAKTIWDFKEMNYQFWRTILKDVFWWKDIFDYPKSLELVKNCITISWIENNITVLDFTAGSWTTGHAVLGLNKEDGGKRKFILCTNNENNICEEVTYERVKRVSQGYTNAKGKEIAGLGGNLRYYKTAFVEVENLKEVTDEKKLELTYNAGELLAIKEWIYNERLKTSYGQVFENTQDIVAVYFKESTRELAGMAQELAKIQQEKWGKVIWYIYGNPFQLEAFPMIASLELKDIPDPILKVYREINKV